MAAYTTVRRRTGTVDISQAVNHRESASVVAHDVRNPNFPFLIILMPVTASKGQTRQFQDTSMP